MSGFGVSPTGQQTMSQQECDAFLRDARMAPTTKSPRVLGINQIPLMRAKNNGYPIDMHHPTLEMRQALKEEEEMALVNMGYQRQYIPKEYPKALFRRNMAPKYEPQFDPTTNLQVNNAFVEEVVCRDETHEKTLRLMKVKPGQSEWCEKITDLPELEDGPQEDPAITIAHLRGQISGLQAEIDKPAVKAKGKKADESVAA